MREDAPRRVRFLWVWGRSPAFLPPLAELSRAASYQPVLPQGPFGAGLPGVPAAPLGDPRLPLLCCPLVGGPWRQ